MGEKDFVTLEIAQILKHKKVCIPFKYWRITKELKTDEVYEKGKLVRFSWGDYTIPAPHLYDVHKYLLEQYGLFVQIYRTGGMYDLDVVDMFGNYNKNHHIDEVVGIVANYYETYEEALGDGIKRALDFI